MVEDQEKVMVMVVVVVVENQDEHYLVVVSVDLGHTVQPNIDCVHQGPKKKEFEKAVVLVEFHFSPDSAALIMLVDSPAIVFDAPRGEVRYFTSKGTQGKGGVRRKSKAEGLSVEDSPGSDRSTRLEV